MAILSLRALTADETKRRDLEDLVIEGRIRVLDPQGQSRSRRRLSNLVQARVPVSADAQRLLRRILIRALVHVLLRLEQL